MDGTTFGTSTKDLSKPETGPHVQPSVLLIDDEIRSDDALVRLLMLEGFRVECAQSGRAGLARAFDTAWQALVLDSHLPDIPGAQVLEELARREVGYPVVAITGWYLEGACEEAARRLGAIDFRTKPLDAGDLGACLHAAIDRVRQEAESPTSSATSARSLPMSPRATIACEAVNDRLHARTILGDRLALDHLMTAMLPDLERRLRQKFRTAAHDLITDAVEDALVEYASRPCRFDLARNVSLSGFLLRAAARNLLNALEAERRRHRREARYATSAAATTGRGETHDVPEPRTPTLSLQDVTSDGAERRALELWRNGERRSAVFARALGLSDRSPLEQRREVKRFKDRIVKRIRRLLQPNRDSRLD